MGAEIVGGAWVESRGFHNPGSALLWTVEESLEMLGIVVFIHALLSHLQLRGAAVTIRVGSGGVRTEHGIPVLHEEERAPQMR